MSDPTRIDINLDPREQRMTGRAIHGDTPFSVPFVSEILPGLWQGGCADGLILPREIEHVVSLYPWEQYTNKHELASYLRVKMYDSQEQAFGQVENIALWAHSCWQQGPTLIHCQAGLNRSSLIVARVLMIDGMNASEAISLIRKTRSPACLCNSAFEAYLLGVAA